MLVLNTQEAVEAFSSGNQVSLGGNVGIAIGPVGRNAGVSANVHGGELATKGEAEADGLKAKVAVAPCYAYSHSKGLFIGISLEGAVIKPRKDVNAKFYGSEASPREILSGMTLPPAAAEPLYEMLAAGLRATPASSEKWEPAAYVRSPTTEQPDASGDSSGGANPFTDGGGAAMPREARRSEQFAPGIGDSEAAAAFHAARFAEDSGEVEYPPVGAIAEETGVEI